jgi:hypothetical protein
VVRKSSFFLFLLILSSCTVYAQSIVGTWESNHPLLRMVHFSITFNTDMTYTIDCILGQTTGTYTLTDNTIHFSPKKSSISAGAAGNIQVYQYAITGENTFYMDENGTRIVLSRTKT